jgi:hypothetical protein
MEHPLGISALKTLQSEIDVGHIRCLFVHPCNAAVQKLVRLWLVLQVFDIITAVQKT